MTVTITPLTPVFAGEVGAIDLRKVHDRASLEAIRAGMDKYAVLVFRDQNFTNEEQLDFAQRFDGTLHARTSSSAIGSNRFGNASSRFSPPVFTQPTHYRYPITVCVCVS